MNPLPYSIIDTNIPLTAEKLADFKSAGVVSIGRYLNRQFPTGAKVIKPAEAKLFAAAGMRLFLIYEFMGKPVTPAGAVLDGEWCVAYCKSIGAPMDGATFIARTMDYDAPESDMPAIKADVSAFGRSIAPAFETWAYASGAVNAELFAAKLITGRWLTCSRGFRGTAQALASGDYEMRQGVPINNLDPDFAHVASQVIGFLPFAEAAA